MRWYVRTCCIESGYRETYHGPHYWTSCYQGRSWQGSRGGYYHGDTHIKRAGAERLLLHSIIWHRPPRRPPLYIPWSQHRRHVSVRVPFWLQKSDRKAQFWGQNDIQTPDTSTNRIECRLQLRMNFSKSARACNVRLCFDFHLYVTLRVLLSVALNHWGRGSTLETSVFFRTFFRTFSTHFLINFVISLNFCVAQFFSNFLL